jgi:hypothetical protein
LNRIAALAGAKRRPDQPQAGLFIGPFKLSNQAAARDLDPLRDRAECVVPLVMAETEPVNDICSNRRQSTGIRFGRTEDAPVLFRRSGERVSAVWTADQSTFPN